MKYVKQMSVLLSVISLLPGFSYGAIEDGIKPFVRGGQFKDLILREQSQVQELQRLAEERIRRDMDEFREDFEKKRRKAELRQEHLWSEQDKYNREVVERFPPVMHDLAVHEALVQQLWKLQETYGNYFLMTAQSWLEGMQSSVKVRDEKIRMMEEEWQRQRRNAELYRCESCGAIMVWDEESS